MADTAVTEGNSGTVPAQFSVTLSALPGPGQTVGVQVTVDNLANPAFEKLSGAGTLTRSGNSFILDLGAVAQGSGLVSIGLGLLNDATGPTDLLTGKFSVSGSSPGRGIGSGANDATSLGHP